MNPKNIKIGSDVFVKVEDTAVNNPKLKGIKHIVRYVYKAKKLKDLVSISFYGTSSNMRKVARITIDFKGRNRRPIDFSPVKPTSLKILIAIGTKFGGMKPDAISKVAQSGKLSALTEGDDWEAKAKRAQRIQSMMEKISIITAIVSFVMLIMTIGYKIYRSTKVSIDEQYANTKAELELNKYLFKGQNGKETAFDAYANLINIIRNVENSKDSKGAIIYGPPGTGKTYALRREMHFMNKIPGKDYTIFKGSVENIGSLYSTLYDYKNKTIVLDDFEFDGDDKQTTDVINLLKGATDSYPIRIISYVDNTPIKSQDDLGKDMPTKFKFEGKIIIITNKKLEDIDSALRSRLPAVEVKFNDKETLKIIKDMVKYFNPDMSISDKMEIVDLMIETKAKHPKLQVDLRLFKTILDIRSSMSNWKETALSIMLSRN